MVDRFPGERRDIVPHVAFAVNGAGVVAAAAFAGIGLVRRGFANPKASEVALAKYWSASSAVRTWALTCCLGWAAARSKHPSAELLAVAGLVQLGDAALGSWQRNPRMATLPALMGVVHLASAAWLRGVARNRSRACERCGLTGHGGH